MEQTSGESSAKDEKMKTTFESSAEVGEKKDSKKKKKSAESSPLPTEKAEKTTEAKAEIDKPLPLFEKIDVEKKEDNPKSPEEVAPAETVEIAESYIEANLPDAAQELQSAEIGTSEEAAAAASVAFMENLEEKLADVEVVDEAVLDEAVAETLEELEVEPAELEAPEEIETPEADTVEAVDDDEDDTATTTRTAVSPPVSPPPSPPTPPTPAVSGGAGAGGGVPPQQPPAGPPGGAAPGNPGGANLNIMPPISQDAEFARRRRRSGDLLLGGIVGYMIGRRRGRINTEKRLMPVQKSLENEVVQLQAMIAAKESIVRQQAARETEKATAPPQKLTEKITEIREKPILQVQTKERLTERVVTAESILETFVEKVETPESPAVRNELIVEKSEKQISPKMAESISLPLALQIAGEISFGGTTLRRMYETGGVDQRNMRKIIKKYLEGERLDRIWPKAVEHEQEYRGIEQHDETAVEFGRVSNRPDGHGESADAAKHVPSDFMAYSSSTPTTPESPKIEDILGLTPKKDVVKNQLVLPAIVVLAAIIFIIGIVILFA